jgi:hypothetical protein
MKFIADTSSHCTSQLNQKPELIERETIFQQDGPDGERMNIGDKHCEAGSSLLFIFTKKPSTIYDSTMIDDERSKFC